MRISAKFWALVAIAAAGFSTPAMAVGICGLTTVNGGTATLNYDPFGGNTANIQVANIILSRINGPGGQKTSTLDFFIKAQSPAMNGTTIVVNSATGSGSGTGYGQNVFYGSVGPYPVPSTAGNTAVPGTFRWDFSGNNAASDTFTVNLTISLPANLNITASSSIPFDIEYACAGTGGGGPFTDTGLKTDAIVANIRVLSAIRASYIGTALDFGEIGTVTNAQASGVTTFQPNRVQVQSSGVYTVALQSQNAFRLKHPSGSLVVAAETVKYNLHFMGLDKNFANTPGLNATAFTVTCARAGVPLSDADNLNLLATLQEGGQGKTPSPGYLDTLTITVTPQIDTAVSSNDCTML